MFWIDLYNKFEEKREEYEDYIETRIPLRKYINKYKPLVVIIFLILCFYIYYYVFENINDINDGNEISFNYSVYGGNAVTNTVEKFKERQAKALLNYNESIGYTNNNKTEYDRIINKEKKNEELTAEEKEKKETIEKKKKKHDKFVSKQADTVAKINAKKTSLSSNSTSSEYKSSAMLLRARKRGKRLLEYTAYTKVKNAIIPIVGDKYADIVANFVYARIVGMWYGLKGMFSTDGHKGHLIWMVPLRIIIYILFFILFAIIIIYVPVLLFLSAFFVVLKTVFSGMQRI